MNPQILWLGIVGAGVLWFIMQNRSGQGFKLPVPDNSAPDVTLSRVEVFARLDELGDYFNSVESDAGIQAIADAHHALIEVDDAAVE